MIRNALREEQDRLRETLKSIRAYTPHTDKTTADVMRGLLVQIDYIAEKALAATEGDGWRSIDSAPRDGTPVWLEWGVSQHGPKHVDLRVWNPDYDYAGNGSIIGAWGGCKGGFVDEESWYRWQPADRPAPPTDAEQEDCQ